MSTPTQEQSADANDKSARRRKGIKRFLVVGLVAGAAVGFMLPASAHGPKGPATPKEVRMKMDAAADFAMEFLDGTDAQRKAVNPILDGLANDMANFRNEGRALRKSFVTAILADRLDDRHLEKIRVEGIKLADKMTSRMLKDLKQFHAVLTPEQRAKLRRMAAKAEKRWQKR